MMKRISGNDENSSSTSLVLNDIDLLIQILLCLPVETLHILKPVSKHWYSVISSSYFMQKHHLLHRNVSISGLYFLCDTPYNEQYIPSYDLVLLDRSKITTNISFVIKVNERPVGLCIYESCNGLLLCYVPSDLHTGTTYIYNPSTRHYRTIPPPPPFQTEINFDHGNSRFYLAFGQLDYDIVCIWGTLYKTDDNKTYYEYQMAVYSSKTGSWRHCGYVQLGFEPFDCHDVFWNGCLNWIDNTEEAPTLFYFNIAQQVLQQMPWLRDEMHNYESEQEYFGECMGHMYMILRDRAPTSNLFGVFEMEIDYSRWKPICRVDLSILANQYGNVFAKPYGNGGVLRSDLPVLGGVLRSYRILKVVVEADGDADELRVLIAVPYKIVSYDIKRNSFQEICEFKMDRYILQPSQPAYIGSLANV